MSDRPSNGGREAEPSAAVDDVSVDGAPAESADGAPAESADGAPSDVDDDGAAAVDDEVRRRLREAYLNDAERELVVTGVRSAGDEVVVEFRTPHGDATHAERFPAPRNGSLTESDAFLAFLETVGVSPLDVDELVGARVPATYDGDGWRLDESYLPGPSEGAVDGDAGSVGPRPAAALARSREWIWTYRYWLFAAVLIGGELLFVALVIVLFG